MNEESHPAALPSRWRSLFVLQTVLLIGTVYVPLVILINSISQNAHTAGSPASDAHLSHVLSSAAILLVGCMLSVGMVISSSIFLSRYSRTNIVKSAIVWSKVLLVAALIGFVVPVGYVLLNIIH